MGKAGGILFIGHFLSQTRGGFSVCEDLAREFAAHGWKVTTASSKTGRVSRVFDMLWTTWSKRREYAILHIDVYSGIAFLWAEMVSALAALLKKPFVLTLHGGGLIRFAGRSEKRVKRLLSAAAAVTAPSAYLGDAFRKYRTDICVIYNPLELGRYTHRIRRDDPVSIGWLRSFHSVYNPVLAVDVMNELRTESIDSSLTMAGVDKKDGALERTRQRIDELGLAASISLKGPVRKEDVPAFMNDCDIFMNTSSVDNAPVTLIEAMAAGALVVTTDVGGISRLVENGMNGILVQGNDPKGFAAAVRSLKENAELRGTLSENARKTAEVFDIGEILPRWFGLFEGLMNGAGE
jgi:glycosyltransferase involved in cell wall biosynthesis